MRWCEAIQRELDQDGQVYYVYNRVSDIAEIADHVQKLVPTRQWRLLTGRWRSMSWKISCMISSTETLMCWCQQRLLRPDWIFPMPIR